MAKQSLWRFLIFLATLFCVVMLFAPLVATVLERLAEEPYLH
jgi:hypothetical protein